MPAPLESTEEKTRWRKDGKESKSLLPRFQLSRDMSEEEIEEKITKERKDFMRLDILSF